MLLRNRLELLTHRLWQCGPITTAMFDITICLIANTDGFFDSVVSFIFVGVFCSFFFFFLPKKPQNSYSVTVYDTLHFIVPVGKHLCRDSERLTRSFALQKNQ